MLSILLAENGGFQLPFALIGVLVFILAFPFSGFVKWDNAVKFELLNIQSGSEEEKLKKLYRFKLLGGIFFRGRKRTEADEKSGALIATSSKLDPVLTGVIAYPVFFIQCAFYFFGVLGIVLSAMYEFSGDFVFKVIMIVYMVLYAIGYCAVMFVAVSKERAAVEAWKHIRPSKNKK